MNDKIQRILNNLDDLSNLNSVISIYQKLHDKNKIYKILEILEEDDNEKFNIYNIEDLINKEEIQEINKDETISVLLSILKIIEKNKNKLITLQFPNNNVISIHLLSENYILDIQLLEEEIKQYLLNYDTLLSPIILVTREITNIEIENKKINYIKGYFLYLNKVLNIEKNDLREMIDYNFNDNDIYHIIYN